MRRNIKFGKGGELYLLLTDSNLSPAIIIQSLPIKMNFEGGKHRYRTSRFQGVGGSFFENYGI